MSLYDLSLRLKDEASKIIRYARERGYTGNERLTRSADEVWRISDEIQALDGYRFDMKGNESP